MIQSVVVARKVQTKQVLKLFISCKISYGETCVHLEKNQHCTHGHPLISLRALSLYSMFDGSRQWFLGDVGGNNKIKTQKSVVFLVGTNFMSSEDSSNIEYSEGALMNAR